MSIFHKFIPSEALRLEMLIEAHFYKLEKRILKIMDELIKNIAIANAEIKDRKVEIASMKAALDLANAEIATLKAAVVVLPAGAMSAEQVASAVAASADLVVAAAP